MGTKVLACVGKGPNGWKPGTIIRQWDEHSAYRVRLDDGVEVWAPIDSDICIKAKV